MGRRYAERFDESALLDVLGAQRRGFYPPPSHPTPAQRRPSHHGPVYLAQSNSNAIFHPNPRPSHPSPLHALHPDRLLPIQTIPLRRALADLPGRVQVDNNIGEVPHCLDVIVASKRWVTDSSLNQPPQVALPFGRVARLGFSQQLIV